MDNGVCDLMVEVKPDRLFAPQLVGLVTSLE